jgi:hypothetical protein
MTTDHSCRPTRAAVWRRAAVFAAIAAAPLLPSFARAQAYGYPSFQQPRTVSREYNFGVAGVGNHGGTALLFQWREGTSAKNQLSLDAGFASPDCDKSCGLLIVGGTFAHQLTTATADMPFDMLFTVGAGGAFGNAFSVFRVPVGLSVGHRFPLDQGMSITPYVHPRIVIQGCSSCGNDNSTVGIDFDLGGSFQINPQFAIRASAGFGSSDFIGDGGSFGLSLAWSPPGLNRR